MPENAKIQDLTPRYEEDEINLLDYWRVIWKRRKLIGWVIVAAVFLTVVISLMMTNIYQSKAVITPVATKDGARGGTLSALAQQFGGLPGIALPGGSSASEIVALLESNILREMVITRYNLMPVLFHEAWDTEKKNWKKGSGINLNPLYYVGKLAKLLQPQAPKGVRKAEEGVPEIWDGIRKLDDIVSVKNNIKDNSITITADFYDPEMAAKLVEYFLLTLTNHMSEEARRVAMTNRKYLEEQLATTADPLIKQNIYNLIAQQLETSMMAEVKENFAFKVIDPPKAPDRKTKPKRAQMVMLSFVVALFLGIFAAFFLEYLEKQNININKRSIPWPFRKR